MKNETIISDNQQAIINAIAAGNAHVAEVALATKLPHTTVSANIFPLKTKNLITTEMEEKGMVLSLSKNAKPTLAQKSKQAVTKKTAKAKKTVSKKTVKAKTKAKGEKSKVDVATEIFIKLSKKGLARKEIIEAFVSEADLTIAGAKTYYFNINKKVNG